MYILANTRKNTKLMVEEMGIQKIGLLSQRDDRHNKKKKKYLFM